MNRLPNVLLTLMLLISSRAKAGRLAALLLATLLFTDTQVQAQQVVIDVNSLPVPASGSTSLSTGDYLVGSRSGITYKLYNSIGVGVCPSNQWMTSLTAQGGVSCAQPSFANIAGAVSLAQLPTGISITIGTSVSAPNPYVPGQPTTGIYTPGINQVGVTTGGIGQIGIGTQGVKIGTSTTGSYKGTGTLNAANLYINGVAVNAGTISLGTSALATNPARNGDLTTGAFSPVGSSIAFSAAGSEVMRVNGTGVGIGSTSPAVALDVQGTIRENNSTVFNTAGTGLSSSGGTVNNSAIEHISFQTGGLTAIGTATPSAFYKFSKTSTVDNIVATAATFSCSVNPTLTVLECGSSATCASSPVTIGTATVSAAGTAVNGTVTSSSVTAGDYVAFEITGGTCTALNLSSTAQLHAN